jgi:diketogulonate reductase-like aldo/keto reductase
MRALDNGFDHISEGELELPGRAIVLIVLPDTAHAYRSEAEADIALRETPSLPSSTLVQTAWRVDSQQCFQCELLGSAIMDGRSWRPRLWYLIHTPRLTVPDNKVLSWSGKAHLYGTSRRIASGVSNFDEKDLEILLASTKTKPAVNQVPRRYNQFERKPC